MKQQDIYQAEQLAHTGNKQSAQQRKFSCPYCGAAMAYHVGESAITCKACGHSESIETAADASVEEHALAEALRDIKLKPLGENDNRVTCSTCGATSTWEDSRLADVCPYCKTPIAKCDDANNRLRIEAIVPFAIEKKEALNYLKKWMKNRWFAPNILKEMGGHSKQFQGVYVPHWTFDSLTETDYTGERGEHYTDYVQQTRIVDGKSKTVTVPVTKTRWYHAAGRVRVMFDDVLVLASMLLPKSIINSLRPWALEEAVPYTPEYLAGLKADYYQLDLDDAFKVAKKRMSSDIHRAICRDIGGDEQRIHSQQTRYHNSTYKLLMLPVWYSAFEYRGKMYQTVINAQTGKVAGEYPKSAAKIAIAAVCGLLILAGAGYWYYTTRG